MIDYEIWGRTYEGYVVQLDTIKARSFEEACKAYRVKHPYNGYNPEELYPSYIDASGYTKCHTVDLGDRLMLMVGDELLFECQMRPAPESLNLGAAVVFPSAEYLASRLRTMVNNLNYEKFRRRCEG